MNHHACARKHTPDPHHNLVVGCALRSSCRIRSKDGQRKTAKDTLACWTVIKCARRAMLLSGTPTESRPYELWHQVDALTNQWPQAAKPLGTFAAFRKVYPMDFILKMMNFC